VRISQRQGLVDVDHDLELKPRQRAGAVEALLDTEVSRIGRHEPFIPPEFEGIRRPDPLRVGVEVLRDPDLDDPIEVDRIFVIRGFNPVEAPHDQTVALCFDQRDRPTRTVWHRLH